MGRFRKVRTVSSGGANPPGPVWGSQRFSSLQAHGPVTSLCCSTSTTVSVWKNVPSTGLLGRTLEGAGGGSPLALLQGQGQWQHQSPAGTMWRETRTQQSPSILLEPLPPLLTWISESPGPVVAPAPAQHRGLGESSTLCPCLAGHPAHCLAPGQPWLALPAQHLATEKARRLSCEQ